MSDCGEWKTIHSGGKSSYAPLSEFDDPLVGILPLALFRIPPFSTSALTLDLPQSWPLPLPSFPNPLVCLQSDPLSTTLSLQLSDPSPERQLT